MSHYALRALVAPVGICTALLLVIGPAQAGQVRFDDRTGDVWSRDQDGHTREGSVVNVDLTRTVVVHSRQALVIRATYKNLRLNDDEVALEFRILTNEGQRRLGQVSFGAGSSRGAHSILRWVTGRQVRCPHMHHAVRYGENKVRVSIPRRCLSRPRWVKVLVVATMYNEESGLFVDDAASGSAAPKNWSRRIKVG